MKKFNQFDIKVTSKVFQGDKIKIARILNQEIIVHDFKIEDSKVPAFKLKGTGQCLHMQIELNGEKHIVFTSGVELIEAIQQIPKAEFPFSTVIIQDDKRLRFT
jgi:hypothetical protein